MGRLRNEIAIMSYLAGHPNIVQIQDVYETEDYIFLVRGRGSLGGGGRTRAP